MPLPEYEYKGLIAQAWDVLRGDTSDWEDRCFFLDVIKKYGQPVLDIGCGTGRLLLDYLAQGIDIDGVDNSPDMLALCRKKAAKLGLKPAIYEQYMEALVLPRQPAPASPAPPSGSARVRGYRTILIPSSSLQLIIDPPMAVHALKRLYAHLLPGGVVAAPIMAVWKAGDPLETEWERTAVRAEDGAAFRRVSRSRYEAEIECEHTEDLYQMIVVGQGVAEELHRRSPATRAYSLAQARALFEGAGFDRVELYSGFTFEPVKADATLFTVVGQKAADP